jgi:hypothetical protein
MSDAGRRRACLLFEDEDTDESKNPDIEGTGVKSEWRGKWHAILFTPLPKFWLNGNFKCITFEVDFNETIYYHVTILGWCG